MARSSCERYAEASASATWTLPVDVEPATELRGGRVAKPRARGRVVATDVTLEDVLHRVGAEHEHRHPLVQELLLELVEDLRAVPSVQLNRRLVDERVERRLLEVTVVAAAVAAVLRGHVDDRVGGCRDHVGDHL